MRILRKEYPLSDVFEICRVIDVAPATQVLRGPQGQELQFVPNFVSDPEWVPDWPEWAQSELTGRIDAAICTGVAWIDPCDPARAIFVRGSVRRTGPTALIMGEAARAGARVCPW